MAVLASSLFTGCSSDDAGPKKASTTSGITVTHPVPGFASNAQWKIKAAGLRPGSVVTKAGIVLVVRGGDGNYTLRGVDAQSGRETWESRPFPSEGGDPVVRATTQFGRPYVLVLTKKGPDQTLNVYDAYSTRQDAAPVSETAMTASSDRGVTMNVSSGGVFFTDAKKPAAAFTIDLPTGNASTYGKSPTFEGSTDGKPMSVMNGAFLIAYPKGYVVASGYSAGSWSSKSIVPSGAKAGTGRVLGSGDSLIISRWEKTSGGYMIIAQSALSGQVVAAVDEGPDEAKADPAAAVRLAFDGSWALWNGYAFNLRSDSGSSVDAAKGVDAAFIVRGTAYGTQGGKPVMVSLKDGASGKVTSVAMRGVGVTRQGTGVFTDGDTVFSVPLK